MHLLRQSTAKVITFGPFVNPTDGVTLVTSLVSALDHASTGIFLYKDGAAGAIRNATVTASTYDSYGNYRVTLNTTDSNTLGQLRVAFAASATNLVVWQDYTVLTATAYDSLIAGTANLSWSAPYASFTAAGTFGLLLNEMTKTAVTLSTALGTTSIMSQLMNKNTSQTFDRTTDSLEGGYDASPTLQAVVDAIWNEARGSHVAAGSFGQGAASVQGNVTGSVASVTSKVTPIDVDGITHASAMELLMAVISGVAAVNISNPNALIVTFTKRDGTTVKATLTHSTTDGVRVSSVINS